MKSFKESALRGVAGVGVMAVAPTLARGDDKAVVLAGVRLGVYTVERIGKRPVVVQTTPEEQEELK